MNQPTQELHLCRSAILHAAGKHRLRRKVVTPNVRPVAGAGVQPLPGVWGQVWRSRIVSASHSDSSIHDSTAALGRITNLDRPAAT